MSKATITVAGTFGDKQIDREGFVKEWKDHARQLASISIGDEKAYFEVQAIIHRIEVLAGEKFDRLLSSEV